MIPDDNKHNSHPEELERIRSTPLRPGVWMTSVLVWATVVALIVRVPTWAGVLLSAITTTSFLVFVLGYIYLFATDHEALRAERWRKRSQGKSREVTQRQQQLTEGEQHYLEPGRQASAVSPLATEPRIRVGDAGRVTNE